MENRNCPECVDPQEALMVNCKTPLMHLCPKVKGVQCWAQDCILLFFFLLWSHLHIYSAGGSTTSVGEWIWRGRTMYTLQKSPLHQWVSEPENVGSMYTLKKGPLYQWVSESDDVGSMYTLQDSPLHQWVSKPENVGFMYTLKKGTL